MSITPKSIYAPLPRTERGKPVSINGDPKGVNMLYCNGSSVIIRNIATPGLCDIYSEHSHQTTCAKYAPSGFYIASGDQAGNMRIWDTTQKEHVLKIELRPLSGAVLDIDWTEDSKRIVAVGDGREKYGACMMWDAGSSVGEITGHSKPIMSAAFRQQRPYRMVTGDETGTVNWFEGPPFKFKRGVGEHTRFVNAVRFSPDGAVFVTVSSDKKAVVYDGKDATKKIELADEKNGGHKGGIYGASWCKDNNRLLTASADKTAKIFDITTGKCVTTFDIGNAVEDQQLGCLWQNDFLLSVSLSGVINYLDANSGKITQVLNGHNKFVTALAVDPPNKSFFSGSYDANLVRWNVDDAATSAFEGVGHRNQISAAHLTQNGQLVTAGMDDSIRVTAVGGGSLSHNGAKSTGLDAPANDVATTPDGSVQIAATNKSVYVVKGGAVVSQTAFKGEATACAISPNGTEVLVGGRDNSIVRFVLSGSSLTAKDTLSKHRGAVVRIAFSPDGSKWASCDVNREVIVWAAGAQEPLATGLVFHSAKINDVAWAPDNRHFATVSLDQNIFVWDAVEPTKRIQIKQAHPGGVNSVRWMDNSTLVTSGQDCSIRTWNVQF